MNLLVTRYLDHFKNTLNDEDILLDKLLENLFEFTIREKLYLTMIVSMHSSHVVISKI